MAHRFDPRHADKLLSAERYALLPPDTLLDLLDVREGEVVLDLGAGPGFFTLPAAKRTHAPVYALDIAQEMLTLTLERAKAEGITQIQPLHAAMHMIPIPDASVTRVLASTVLHETDRLDETLREIRRVLRPGGKLLIIEWDMQATTSGPPLHHRLPKERLHDQLVELGFSVEDRPWPPDYYLLLGQLRASSCQ